MWIINLLISSKDKKEAVINFTVRGRPIRDFLARQRASMSFEFAILVPIFLLLVCGIVDFGHAWFMKMEITSASREAARYGTRFQTGNSNKRIIPSALNPSIASWVTTNYAGLLSTDANLQATPGGPGYTSGAVGEDLKVMKNTAKRVALAVSLAMTLSVLTLATLTYIKESSAMRQRLRILSQIEGSATVEFVGQPPRSVPGKLDPPGRAIGSV